jgi:hypothetical protein
MWLSVGLGVVTLVMAYLGYHYSVPHEVSRKKRWLLRIAFIGLSIVSLALIAIQGHHADRSEAEARDAERDRKVVEARLNDTLDRVGRQTGQIQEDETEIKRVQGLNTDLQNKVLGQSGQLLDSSKRISDLSKEAIETITGGESFCYMYVDTTTTAHPFPVFITEGKRPLYEVHARVNDLRGFDAMLKRPHTISELLGTQITVGELSPTNAKMEFEQVILLSDSARVDFNVFFDARNGDWTELLRMRKVGNNWVEAIRVVRETYYKNGKTAEKTIFEQIPKEFPEVPDWKKKKP